MGHVGRHARSFRSLLGSPSRSPACAPSATAGEFPRSWSLISDALSSRQFPRGMIQATTTELGSGFRRQQDLDIFAVRLFKSPWHAYPSSAVILSCHGSSEQIRRSLYSSVLKRSSSSTTASVGPSDSQTIEQLWKEYFASPSQWWDNRSLKKNPRSPDFKHKVTGNALRIDGWYTPAWVKAKFKLVAQVGLQSDATYTKYSQDIAQGKRQPKGNNGKLYTAPESDRALGQIVQGGGGNLQLQSANTLGEAVMVLKSRLQQGFIIDSYMYVQALKRCLKQKDLLAAKQVHDFILKCRMGQNTYVVNNLMRVYIGCGRLQEARRAFDALVKKDGLSWNIMIGGYAQLNHAEDAMGLFNQMCHEAVQPNEVTYLTILKAFANSSALNWGEEVHANIRHGGLESDVLVGTALLQMYAKCGCIEEARHIFDNLINRDAFSWNVMIGACADSGRGEEAYQLFLQMKQEGFQPTVITYTSILNARASAGALPWVKKVHRHALDGGLESDLRVGSALLHMYAKSGSIADARLVFDRMEVHDVVTWTVMIGGLAEHGCGQEAYELFLQMQREGCKPNAITYLSILNASASAGALVWVKEVHRHALKAGLELDLRVGNALVHMYAKSGSIHDAKAVFDRMKERDVITWNAMIDGLAEHGCGQEAYELFLQMQREGFKPDAITYTNVLNASVSAGALEWVKKVHKHALDAELEWDVCMGNALVHMYAKSGSIDDARAVFARMKERDVITWNAMIGGLGQHGFGHEALGVFREMNARGVKPDVYTFVAVLSACSHSGLVDEGCFLYSAMTQEHGIEPVVSHCNCMVDLLGRAGRLEKAKLFIGNMAVEPDEATWGALLGACKIHGNVELGEFAAKELLKLNPEGAATYVLLSNIYAGAGRWDMVSSVQTMMRERGIRKEVGRSWIEVDNKIHDFVVADLSHTQRKEIYENKDRVIEKIKAEGYIPDTRLVLKNIDEEGKELDICSHSEKLAIVYGLMRTSPGNPIRVFKNLRVCTDCHTATKFIAKVEGREIIVRDANRFHHFKDGVCSCGDYW